MRARTIFNRIMISLLLAMLVFAGTPFATGTAAASAASPYWKNANAKVTSETSVMLTWKKLTKKQQKKISGIAVFRDGKAVKKLKKTAKSYSDTNVEAGKYTYQLKTYKKSSKKVKMYWNKKTGKWQTKKIKGAKTKKVKKTIYKNASPKMVVTVDAAKPEEEDVKPGQDDVQPGQDDAQSGQDGTQSGQEDTQPGDTGGDRTEPDLDKIRKDMLDLVNAEREKAGVSPLSLQDEINVCAQEKARDMYTSGKLDHHSDTLGYVQDQFGKHGISANGMGENIAMGQSSVSDVMKSWINSPGHYENIVYSDYTHAGFGYYKGYWVQQFADSPRVNGSDFPEATITCPRCGTTKKESEFGNAMSYTTTGYDGSVIKMYQCNCINIMYLCPKCNTLMEEAGISDNGSVSHKCPKCGYSNTKECYVKCGSCNADLLNNTIEDDFVLHFQGDLSEGSTDFNEVLIELDYCSTCGKYAFINQASRKLYTEMYAKYQQKIGDGEDIYDHIKWYYMVEGEKEQTGENSWVTHRYRKEIPTRKISSLEELLGSSRLYTRD